MALSLVLRSQASMGYRKSYLTLVVSLGAVAAHFATVQNAHAQQGEKTVEQSADPVPQLPPTGMLPHALLSLSTDTGTFSEYAFLVDKKARTLTVWRHAGDEIKLVGAWPTDIGSRDGDKLVQGDQRTPEGVYFFQTSMDGRKVNFNEYGNRIFTLDYPNYFDKLENKTGNGIWFHAIPDSKSLLRGSRGCVVVRNTVIEELSKFVELKRTPMVIVNQVDYMEPEKWRALKTGLHSWVDNWRKSWMGKDLNAYMDQYSHRFSGNGMNKHQWRRYKETLAKAYGFINVELKDVQIFNQGPKVVFRFLQAYQSDRKKDFGTKILYALRNGDRWEIIGETWNPANDPVALAK